MSLPTNRKVFDRSMLDSLGTRSLLQELKPSPNDDLKIEFGTISTPMSFSGPRTDYLRIQEAMSQLDSVCLNPDMATRVNAAISALLPEYSERELLRSFTVPSNSLVDSPLISSSFDILKKSSTSKSSASKSGPSKPLSLPSKGIQTKSSTRS